jgi:hypothetical protein
VDDSLYGYATSYGLAYGDHPGVDIGTPDNTPLFAPVSGTVIQTGPNQYFDPQPVYIKGDDNREWILGHMSTDAVATNQRVAKGDYLGRSGHPWYAGPHVHVEVRQPADPNGKQIVVDPLPLLSGGATSGTTGGPSPSTKGSSSVVSKESFLQRFGYIATGIALASIGLIIVVGKQNIERAAKVAVLA